MASSIDFVNFVCEQISGAGDISYKKMFGEYGIYCNGKIIGLICDNMFYVKKTEEGLAIMGECEEASPYTNAKPHFLIGNLDNRELMSIFILETYKALPMPKEKKKK